MLESAFFVIILILIYLIKLAFNVDKSTIACYNKNV